MIALILCAIEQAVRAIGRCAVTLERAAERCINVLLDLIKQKVNYVVQEAVVVITDIFRRYPNRCCSSTIALLCHKGLRLEALQPREEGHSSARACCQCAKSSLEGIAHPKDQGRHHGPASHVGCRTMQDCHVNLASGPDDPSCADAVML